MFYFEFVVKAPGSFFKVERAHESKTWPHPLKVLTSTVLQCTYVCHCISYLRPDRQNSFDFFETPTDRQPLTVFSLFLFAIPPGGDGPSGQRRRGPPSGPLTRPEGEVQVRWLAGRVGRDCSKLAVGRFADAEQGCWCSTSSLGLSVWAQSASTSSCQPACLFCLWVRFKG